MKQSKEKYQKPRNKVNGLQKLFLLCSGADVKILMQCRTEWNKYAGIGATILFTGILASISGGYALHAIFRNSEHAIWYALGFGLFWGMVIFNLDRFIVSTIRKEGKIGKEAGMAIPRICLAIIISIVIAKPLEVKIFEDRIYAQIEEKKLDNMEAGLTKIENITSIRQLNEDTENVRAEIEKLEQEKLEYPTTTEFKEIKELYDQREKEYQNIRERNNRLVSGYNREIYELDQITRNTPQDSFQSEKNRIKELQLAKRRRIDEIAFSEKYLNEAKVKYDQAILEHNTRMEEKIAAVNQNYDQKLAQLHHADSITATLKQENQSALLKSYSPNFITQLEALSALTQSDKTLRRISQMIILLFLILETAPVFVKLLTKRGPYDEILERTEYELKVREKEAISKMNTEISQNLIRMEEMAKLEKEMVLRIQKDKLDHELKVNKNILDEIAQKQESLAKEHIEKWYQDELFKMNSNTASNGNIVVSSHKTL